MCSASQPSFLANMLPSLRAKHFFPRRELPPYPEPKDTIMFSSGMWEINVFSGLQGQLFTMPEEKGRQGGEGIEIEEKWLYSVYHDNSDDD